MNLNQFAREDGRFVRRYDYEDDETVVAADLGGADATVDIVDGTAIVVYADGEQVELDLPAGDAKAFIRNGVLTIELEADE